MSPSPPNRRAPWQPHLLASGGGTADRCIRLWDTRGGTLLNEVDTESQVCALQVCGGFVPILGHFGVFGVYFGCFSVYFWIFWRFLV
jgi:hypothetical protein